MKNTLLLILLVLCIGITKVHSQEISIIGGWAENLEYVSDGTEGNSVGVPFLGVSYGKAINPGLTLLLVPTFSLYNSCKLENCGRTWRNLNFEMALLSRSSILRTRAVKFVWGAIPGLTLRSNYIYEYNPTSSGDIIFDLNNPEWDPDAVATQKEKVEARNPFLKVAIGVDFALIKRFTISTIFDYRITNLSPAIPPFADYEDQVNVVGINMKVAYQIK